MHRFLKSFLEMTPGPSAHLSLGKASHIVNPAVNGIRKCNLSHEETVIILKNNVVNDMSFQKNKSSHSSFSYFITGAA